MARTAPNPHLRRIWLDASDNNCGAHLVAEALKVPSFDANVTLCGGNILDICGWLG